MYGEVCSFSVTVSNFCIVVFWIQNKKFTGKKTSFVSGSQKEKAWALRGNLLKVFSSLHQMFQIQIFLQTWNQHSVSSFSQIMCYFYSLFLLGRLGRWVMQRSSIPCAGISVMTWLRTFSGRASRYLGFRAKVASLIFKPSVAETCISLWTIYLLIDKSQMLWFEHQHHELELILQMLFWRYIICMKYIIYLCCIGTSSQLFHFPTYWMI